MDYTSVTNPVYGDADKQTINCTVAFEGFDKPLPFVATADDPEAHGAEIYADLIAGKYGDIGAYVVPPVSPQAQYTAALAAGLALTSASAASLNGVYNVQDTDIAGINAQAQYVSMYGEFTSGSSLQWPDSTGTLHTFSTTALFLAFAKAAVQYSAGCRTAYAVLLSGKSATFPSNAAAIG